MSLDSSAAPAPSGFVANLFFRENRTFRTGGPVEGRDLWVSGPAGTEGDGGTWNNGWSIVSCDDAAL